MNPRRVQEAPQEHSSWTQEASKGSNLIPSRHPRRPEDLRTCSPRAFQLQTGPNLEFDDPTTLFESLERSGRPAGVQVGAHIGCTEAKLELRRACWRPNRLEQCSQCRLYRSKWRPRDQGGQYRQLYRAQLGVQETRLDSTDGCTEANLAVLKLLSSASSG